MASGGGDDSMSDDVFVADDDDDYDKRSTSSFYALPIQQTELYMDPMSILGSKMSSLAVLSTGYPDYKPSTELTQNYRSDLGKRLVDYVWNYKREQDNLENYAHKVRGIMRK